MPICWHITKSVAERELCFYSWSRCSTHTISRERLEGHPVCLEKLIRCGKAVQPNRKEAWALVWACERFDLYVCGQPFELETDHKLLERIYSSTSRPRARIERWVLH